MAKLKLISSHKLENVPDHVIQEIQDFSIKLVMHNLKMVESVNPNIALSALNWMTAVMIKNLVSDNPEELRKAAKFSCMMLTQNMEFLINQMEQEKNDGQKD